MSITAKLSNGDFVFGVERENINRLIAGKPFTKNLAEFGGPPINIFIVFGETEADLVRMLSGGVTADTHIQDDRNRKKS